jgi:hypothetical protein
MHARGARDACLACVQRRVVYECMFSTLVCQIQTTDESIAAQAEPRERIPFQSTYLLATPIVQQLNAIHAVFIDFSNSKCCAGRAIWLKAQQIWLSRVK